MPPSLETMEDLIKQRQVTISLSDINEEEPLAHRIFSLKSPDWSIQIGRGNSVDQGTIPGADNAWFTSKVVSRHHATIKAHPRSMILTIEDNNSMHGTYLNETVVKREPLELLEGDVITFGTDIVRHHETFSPLKTRITYEWMEEDSPPEAQLVPGRNTFTADYSDQDIFSEDEIEIVKATVRQPSVEILGIHSTKLGPASSSTNSPSNNSVQSAGASSATTTRIDLSIDEDSNAKSPSTVQKTTRLIVDLEDSDDEQSDMEDYDISTSENLSVNDMDPVEDDSEYEKEIPEKGFVPQIPSVVPAEKCPREPSPSDAALPGLRSVAPPKIQSVPSFASLMPPPPPAFLQSSSEESYRPHASLSPFGRGFCGNDIAPTSYQPTQPFSPVAPFGYDFSALNPPSPLRAPTFASYGSSFAPTWGYPSVNMPQPTPWIEPSFSPSPGHAVNRSNKRKADDISSDSEEEVESDFEDDVSEQSKDAEVPSEAPPALGNTESVLQNDEITPDNNPVMPELVSENGTTDMSENSPVEAESIEKVLPVEQEASEPARKRVKLEVHEPKRPGSTIRAVAKYAATASAGAVVGAVGVIIGLASLPQDYFA